MSRGFVNEDSQQAPVFIPPRAPLPEGVPNYVTPRGKRLLLEEREALERRRSELADVEGDEARRERAVLAGTLQQLHERIARAQTLDPARQAPDAVRFGATVTVQPPKGAARTVQIVGVDEAAWGPADDGVDRVAFLAPIARAVTGKRPGDSVVLETAAGPQTLTITALKYEG